MNRDRLIELLKRLEQEMRRLSLWQAVSPTKEALTSQEPFCLDTMGFDQWLQWVFVARLRAAVEANASLPRKSEISPLAQEFFKTRGKECDKLLSLIVGVDELFNAS